jgi:hypothetical protein
MADMTSSADGLRTHPIAGFAARLHQALDELAETAAWSMTPAEQQEALVELARGQARMEELRLRVLAAADHSDIAAESAATSTGAWVAYATRQPRGQAHRDVTVALALDEELGATRDALADGAVDGDQARVIVAAVQALSRQAPEAVAADPSIPQRAEKHLIELAADFDAVALKRLGRHVLEVLEPGIADQALGKKLESEQAAAARVTFLELFDNGDGTHAGRFKIPTLHAAMLLSALEAFTNPSHRHPLGRVAADSGTARKRTRPELLGQAFSELLERLDPSRLPASGGSNATVVVTLDYEKLLSGLGTARLGTGEQISAGQARRLACQAGVIPAVVRRLVDGRSVVLDLGRKRRLFSEHQRIALAIEQGGCTAEACGRPAAWCHAHHDMPWNRGGRTDLANGRLLCPYHHGKAHATGYGTTVLSSGQVRFHRRT